VAEALAYAHRQNVVHRDIKPANIMYELDSDTVKVTDFGIARITDSSKTKTGLVLGTPSFMSPEQLAGKKVDGRSDLYSLGVMLFQMLTGVLPFRGESMAELMFKIANEEAPDIRIIRKELPESLANLVALSVSKRPETRYQDGDQFAADLRAVMNEITGGIPGTQSFAVASNATAAVQAPTPAGHEKTAVFATAAVAASPATAGHEKTAVFATGAVAPAAAPAAAPDFDKTSIQPASRAAAPAGEFEKTAVHQTRAAPPSAAGGSAVAPDIEI
jgi:serine/threonine-protein kinase